VRAGGGTGFPRGKGGKEQNASGNLGGGGGEKGEKSRSTYSPKMGGLGADHPVGGEGVYYR